MILCTLCCLWQGGKGKLAVLGSCHMFSDQYIDKEENGKILVSFNTHVPVCLYMSVCVSIAICVNKCVDSCVNSVSCWWWLVNKHVNSCCVIPLSPSGCESLRWGVSHKGSSSPLISILCVHWCEIQGGDFLWDGVYPLLFICLFHCLPRFQLPCTSALMQWSPSQHWTLASQSCLTHLVCNACHCMELQWHGRCCHSFLVLQCDTVNSCILLVFVAVHRTLCSTF